MTGKEPQPYYNTGKPPSKRQNAANFTKIRPDKKERQKKPPPNREGYAILYIYIEKPAADMSACPRRR